MMLAFLAAPALADTVVLRSADGTIDVSGQLLEFADDFYVIQTDLGALRVSSRLVFCEGDACPTTDVDAEEMLRLAGPEIANQTLLPLLVAGYASAQNAEADVTIQGEARIARIYEDQGFGEEAGIISAIVKRSDVGLQALLDNQVDIALTNRRITREEARAFSSELNERMVDPANEQVVALDSLAIIVHPDNPVSRISLADLQAIYEGRITNWRELGGEDRPIRALRSDTAYGTEAEFLQQVAHNTSGDAPVLGDTEASIIVSQDPGAIGHVSLALQRGNKAVDIEMSCGIQHAPSSFTTKTEEYPLVRRVYMYNRGSETDQQKSGFWDFVVSQDADALIAKSGFIDLGMERVSLNTLNESAAEVLKQTSDPFVLEQTKAYLEQAETWDRLSITFRFDTASTRLDEKAKRDLERLASYVSGLDEGATLAIVGFTDADGPATNNLRLGEERALAIRSTLQDSLSAAGVSIDIETKSFGEFAPVACNDNSRGKSINRRVEVWIKN